VLEQAERLLSETFHDFDILGFASDLPSSLPSQALCSYALALEGIAIVIGASTIEIPVTISIPQRNQCASIIDHIDWMTLFGIVMPYANLSATAIPREHTEDRPERQKGTRASNRRLNSKAARIEIFLVPGFVSIEIAARLHARRVPILQRMAHSGYFP
jgi:hypothetical protein